MFAEYTYVRNANRQKATVERLTITRLWVDNKIVMQCSFQPDCQRVCYPRSVILDLVVVSAESLGSEEQEGC